MQEAKEKVSINNLIKNAESLAAAYTNRVLKSQNTDAIFAPFNTVNKKQFNKIFMFC